MNKPIVERLAQYSEEDAAGIGRLLPFLSPKFNGDPIPRELLEAIIQSPLHDQIVAKIDSKIVGVASLSMVMGVGSGRKGWIEDFVTDEEIRGQGIGEIIWSEIILWCKQNDISLFTFTSNPSREEAHRFYDTKGAEIYETDFFKVNVE